MTAAARNLAWEVLAKGRLTLAGLAAALVVACVVATWRGASLFPGAVDGFADLFVFAMVLSLLLVFGMFNHTHLDRRSGQTGFPNRLFTYPVSTSVLVGVPMLCGVATTVALYIAWTQLVIVPLGGTMPATWPALVLAAAMAWYQATLWSLAAFRIARLVALCVFGTILVMLAILGGVDSEFAAWTERRTTVAALLALIGGAYAVALLAVKRQRHGGGHGAGLRSILDRLMDALPSRDEPFQSPAHAQFWLESRRSALLLPAGMLLVMLFVILSASILGRVDARLTWFTLCTITAAPLVLAALAGSVASLPIATASDSSLSPFLSTRPMDCGDMVAAKLASAAVAVTLAWIIVLVLTPIWLVTWCDATPLTDAWARFTVMFPGGQRWMMLALCAATVWLLTWRMSVVNLYVAVTGRPLLFTAYVIAGIHLATVATIIFLAQFDAAVRIGVHGTLFQDIVMLAWTLNAALIMKLVIAATSTARGLSHGWLTARSASIYGVIWVASTGTVALTLYLLATRATSAHHMPWLGLLASLVGLLLMPVARIALAPRILAETRHR